MQIRAANDVSVVGSNLTFIHPGRQRHDRIRFLFDLWLLDVVQPDVADSVEHECFTWTSHSAHYQLSGNRFVLDGKMLLRV